jgi:hypothetical protein
MAMARPPRRRPPRRRRAPRWLLLGLVLSLVTLGVAVVSSAGGDGPARRYSEQTYLDQVRPLVERSSEQGAELARVRAQVLRLGRDAVQRQLARLAQDAQAVLADVPMVEAPPSMSVASSVLVTTMAVRARAAVAAQEGFSQAYAAGAASASIDILTRAGEEAVASDRTYEVFIQSLPGAQGGPPVGVPASRWVPDARLWDRGELSVLVGAVKSSASPTPVHDLVVLVVTTKPPAVGTEGPASVLPVVRAFQLEVVVANVGNAVEREVPVVGSLTGVGGSVETVQGAVDLEPGQRRSLPLNGLRPVPPGPAALKVVVGPVSGETNMADNERTQLVVMRGS